MYKLCESRLMWRCREVYMLAGFLSSPKDGDLLSGSFPRPCITCGHVAVHCLRWGGGDGGRSISTDLMRDCKKR